jgi:UDP-glucose 4-epimerase
MANEGRTGLKILVTGGAGFIGSHICDTLVKAGNRVIAADNMILGSRANLTQLDGRGDFELVEMDVANIDRLKSLFEKQRFDCVFHMAANSDIAKSHADPSIDVANTFQSTYAVLEAMRCSAVKQIIFASSSAIYGDIDGAIAENSGPLMPISHYGAAKLASEAFISSYGENYGIQSWMARFPNVVGDRSTHGAIFDFVNKLKCTPDTLTVLGNGLQIKPYLHVTDLIDAILLAWERLDERTNFFNVGGSTRCSVRRMAEIVVEESGRNALIEYTGGDRGWIGDVPSVEYDTGKIRALGWTPKLDSEQAVRSAARWLFKQTA